MKKIISLFLALLMVFSITTVAFAEDAAADDSQTTTQPSGDADEGGEGESEAAPETDDTLQWLLDLPFWTVGPALKFAKIALKLVKVYVKLAIIFGIIDKDDIIGQIEDLIAGAMGSEEAPETETTVPEEGTTVPAA